MYELCSRFFLGAERVTKYMATNDVNGIRYRILGNTLKTLPTKIVDMHPLYVQRWSRFDLAYLRVDQGFLT